MFLHVAGIFVQVYFWKGKEVSNNFLPPALKIISAWQWSSILSRKSDFSVNPCHTPCGYFRKCFEETWGHSEGCNWTSVGSYWSGEKSPNNWSNLSKPKGNVLSFIVFPAGGPIVTTCTSKQPDSKHLNHYHQDSTDLALSKVRVYFKVTVFPPCVQLPVFSMLFWVSVLCIFSKCFHLGYLQRGKPPNSLWEIHNYNLKDTPLRFMFAPSQHFKVSES